MAKKKATKSADRSKPRPAGKRPAQGTVKKKAGAKKREAVAAPSKPITLGRPTVTGEELLYMLFKEDFHARQIFEFLRVETVKELEQHSPQEIIKRLSQPLVQTVERIRRALAARNRSLAGDEQFALDYKSESSS